MRYAILVDAGYFYAALATRMTGSSNRAAVNVDEESLIHRLMDQAQAECGAEPLRVLWYDGGTNGMPDIHQRRIGNFDGVKLRMGRMNSYGEQKGVDLRLGLDLVLMAVHHTVEFAYVISGDDDLTEAVEDAQQLGLRVKVLAVPSADDDAKPFGVAQNLALAADGVLLINPESINNHVLRAARVTAPMKLHVSPIPGPRPTPATLAKAHREATGDISRSAPSTPALEEFGAPTYASQPRVPISQGVEAGSTPPASVPSPKPPTDSTYTSHGRLAYSSSTDGIVQPHGFEEIDVPEETIREAARRTLSVWSLTASEEELDELKRGRPIIPQDVDRILLADLANACDIYDLPLWARKELRNEFWTSVDEMTADTHS